MTTSNVNVNSGGPESEDFHEKSTSAVNPRFPTFHQPQNLVRSELDSNAISFRKKMEKTQQNFPLNSKYTSSEFFNFYGVLNFKVKKFNKGVVRDAFESIFDRACNVESRHRMLAFGMLVRKDNVLLNLNRLSTEVNRRFNIRNQNLFRISKGLKNKAKICLRMLKLFRTGELRHARRTPHKEQPSYAGRISQRRKMFELEL